MKPEFNKERAMEILNKQVLVGITICDHAENILEQRQFHGEIVRVDETEGIMIKINNSSEEYTLPPVTEAFKEAPPGEYRLRATGEVVTNPDLLTTWTIKKPDKMC